MWTVCLRNPLYLAVKEAHSLFSELTGEYQGIAVRPAALSFPGGLRSAFCTLADDCFHAQSY